MDVLAMLDRARAEINVLEHPFYVRWRAGELGSEELAAYAQQYRHAVIALAHTSASAAREARPSHAPALRGHAAEEAAHVELWERFARAACERSGHDSEEVRAQALAETRECVGAWTAGDDLLEHLAVLYALEASQPEIAATKLEGLLEHYGYTPESPAVEYFRVHAVRDHDHAALAGALIERLIDSSEAPGHAAGRLVRRAREALRGNWRLLDGVDAPSPARA